jgi:hypothetical protein
MKSLMHIANRCALRKIANGAEMLINRKLFRSTRLEDASFLFSLSLPPICYYTVGRSGCGTLASNRSVAGSGPDEVNEFFQFT